MSLVGKFLFIYSNEYYQQMEIIEKINEEIYMIKSLSEENENNSNIFFLIHVSTLLSDIGNEQGFNPSVYMFDTEEKLNDFIAHVESPVEEKKILSLVKKEV